MTEAERIDAIEQRCRQHRRYPETLVEAIVQYLKGQGTLAQARDEWQAAVQKKRYLYAAFINLSDGEVLDALDLRTLDLCILADSLPNPLHQILQQSRFDQACDYLLNQGIDEQQLIGWMMILVEHAVDRQDQITRLGQCLLSYLPEQTDELLKGLRDQTEKPYKARLYPAFIKLLVKAQPPILIWPGRLLSGASSPRQERLTKYPIMTPRLDNAPGFCLKLTQLASPPGHARSPGQRAEEPPLHAPSPSPRSCSKTRRSTSPLPSRPRVPRCTNSCCVE